MPVMEGKAVLYEQLVGISAVPILIESTDVDHIVQTVKTVAPTLVPFTWRTLLLLLVLKSKRACSRTWQYLFCTTINTQRQLLRLER